MALWMGVLFIERGAWGAGGMYSTPIQYMMGEEKLQRRYMMLDTLLMGVCYIFYGRLQ